MLKKIESIRKKPKAVRDRYAFWSALGFTTVIVLFWLISVPSRLDFVTTQPETNKEEKNKGGFARSFANFKDQVSQSVSSIKNGEEVIQEDIQNEPEIDNQIDLESIFSTSTVKRKVAPKKEIPILIGTSTPSTTTPTTY